MDGSALRGETGPEPGWGDVRRAVIRQAEAVSGAVAALRQHPAPRGAVRAAEQAAAALRETIARLRPAEFDEAVIEEERTRAADEALAAAGVTPPSGPDLHSV